MFSGFYTAASGILVQQRTLNVLTNNIANAKTPGYRAERVVSQTFDNELQTRIENGKTQVIGSTSPIRLVRDVPVNFEASSYEETGRPYDMAVVGQGFFNIQMPAVQDEAGLETQASQTVLTRNGNFALDAQGYLELPGVGRVLGQKGEIKLGSADFLVASDGQIVNAKGKTIDTILVTQPAGQAQVEKLSNGLYRVENPEENLVFEEGKVLQGGLEQSNIDVNQEYTLVMEAQRAFQSCSQALKIVDAMNQKAANSIAAL